MNVLRSSVRVFFGFAVRAGYLAIDPSRLVRRARCGTAPPRALTQEESTRLLSTLAAATDRVGVRDFALFHTLLGTGIRLGSAIALDVGDVDLAAEDLVLRRTKGDCPTRVVLPTGLRDHLARFIRGREHGPLFQGPKGRALTPRQVQRRLSMWLWRAGVLSTASPHSLRHSFAANLYNATGDVLLVKEALGHKDVSSTMVYARTDRIRLREAVANAAPGIDLIIGPATVAPDPTQAK